jgi:hypothetical protein
MIDTKNKTLTFEEVDKILKNINFSKHSCIDMGWKFELTERKGSEDLYLIRTSFLRKDINTGEIGWGWGRWHTTPVATANETSIVMTAWVCVKMIVEHELLEGFEYHGKKVFNPHQTLETLVYPDVLPDGR